MPKTLLSIINMLGLWLLISALCVLSYFLLGVYSSIIESGSITTFIAVSAILLLLISALLFLVWFLFYRRENFKGRVNTNAFSEEAGTGIWQRISLLGIVIIAIGGIAMFDAYNDLTEQVSKYMELRGRGSYGSEELITHRFITSGFQLIAGGFLIVKHRAVGNTIEQRRKP